MATSFDIGWEEVKSNSNNGYMTLEAGKAGNRIRIVSKPARIDVHWETNAEGRKKINCLGSKCILCEHGSKVQTRYQLLVLDKTHWSSENGYAGDPEVKVLEVGSSIMKSIKEFALSTDYGDPSNYDITITKTGAGKETRYSALPSPKQIPLTEDEKEAVNNAQTLKEFNKMHTTQEILDMHLDILAGEFDEEEEPEKATGSEDSTQDEWADFS